MQSGGSEFVPNGCRGIIPITFSGGFDVLAPAVHSPPSPAIHLCLKSDLRDDLCAVTPENPRLTPHALNVRVLEMRWPLVPPTLFTTHDDPTSSLRARYVSQLLWHIRAE